MDFGILIEKSLYSEVGQKLRLTRALNEVQRKLDLGGVERRLRSGRAERNRLTLVNFSELRSGEGKKALAFAEFSRFKGKNKARRAIRLLKK